MPPNPQVNATIEFHRSLEMFLPLDCYLFAIGSIVPWLFAIRRQQKISAIKETTSSKEPYNVPYTTEMKQSILVTDGFHWFVNLLRSS